MTLELIQRRLEAIEFLSGLKDEEIDDILYEIKEFRELTKQPQHSSHIIKRLKISDTKLEVQIDDRIVEADISNKRSRYISNDSETN